LVAKRKRFSIEQITGILKQAELRTPIAELCRQHGVSEQSYYYRIRMDPLPAMRRRVRELAQARVRFGYRRIYILLRREGWDVGKSRFYRVYCEENGITA
jgi:putative transposase